MHRVLSICLLACALGSSACDNLFDDLFEKNKEEPKTDPDDNNRDDGNKQAVYRMAVLGDSVAVGLFSDMTMGEDLAKNDRTDKFERILSGITDFDKAGILAGLDSYYKANIENAYSCGADVGSCSFSLAHHLGLQHDEVKNLAVSGSMVAPAANDPAHAQRKLTSQLTGLTTDMQHFVINIGGNDFCDNGFDQGTFITELDKVIKDIYAKNDQAKILVATIPNIIRLFSQVALDGAKAAKLPEQEEDMTCGDIRGTEGLDLCPRLNAANADQDELASELVAVNTAIAALKNTHTKLRVATAIKDVNFTTEHLSVDCFHPNTKGLQLIAAEVRKLYPQ